MSSARSDQVVSIQTANTQSKHSVRSNHSTAQSTTSVISSTVRVSSVTPQIRNRVVYSDKILPDFEIHPRVSLQINDLELKFGKTEPV